MAIARKQLIKALAKDFETSASDYSSSLKKQCDRLANYATIAMQALEENGHADFVLLKHDDLHKWWNFHKKEIAKAEEARVARERRAEVKARVLARLTDEEKEVLGLKK